MSTGIDRYTFTYNLSKVLKTYSVYSLDIQKSIICEPFTEIIRIEDFRGFSKGKGFDKYLRVKDCSNWAKAKQVTGLRPFKNIFYGDYKDKNGIRSLIVFVFSDNVLKIHFYPLYCPNIKELHNVLENYVKQ